jgi:hypothetical protein
VFIEAGMVIENNIAASRAANEITDLILADAELYAGRAKDRFVSVIANRLIESLPEHMRPQRVVESSVRPMEYQEVLAFGKTSMPFGKHAGRCVDAVGLDYLTWLNDQYDFRLDLRRYMAAPCIQSEISLREESDG